MRSLSGAPASAMGLEQHAAASECGAAQPDAVGGTSSARDTRNWQIPALAEMFDPAPLTQPGLTSDRASDPAIDPVKGGDERFRIKPQPLIPVHAHLLE